MNLADIIPQVLHIDPAANAIEYDERWATYGELAHVSGRISSLLAGMDLAPDTRVGVLLRNQGDLVPVLLSLFSSNLCLATFNASSPDAKLVDDLGRDAVPVLIGTAADIAREPVRAAARDTGAAIIAIEGQTVSLVEKGGASIASKPVAPGIVIEMLSSGTTGTPKRIPLGRKNFEKALMGAMQYEKGRDPDSPPRLRKGVHLQTAPLAHIAGLIGLMNNFLAGRQICLIDKFDLAHFHGAIMRHRPKVVSAPPAALRMIFDANIPKEDFASLAAFRTGTAPLDPDLADAFYDRYAIPVLQNYGATEFAGGVAGWTMDDFKAHWKAKRGSVGRLNKGVEAHAVDPESGQVLPPGEQGLLELRAPNIKDGVEWIRTTDLAVVDEDRFLFLRGRHDGVIVRGGFKIMPDDIVKAMQSHPAVREAAVVGIKDRRLGEVPVAGWLARTGAELPEEDAFRSWLKERLLPYQVPVRIRRLDEFPRTPSLKVDQPALREILAGEVSG
ncbi:class I adenylate-forming enzyme family protein [Novosphingobium pentaromativorans]|uniref:AMP-dependent synthetase and ligase n=1 Tax=Novosphingobium pentaromativorans US6-1 TaxID=1088721 RepID=G6E840_9SPHN|nr:fatty acid--CoA ligase family protein [Novosphingobium pentaromativorans]AIT81452.1 AMP-dependent synthetase [Novosphingobium pentaromativorans US6-1]EHJ62380.1 AMP-dependent synthetase and ligase [Novosphingobium pentaromativorans US6-1]